MYNKEKNEVAVTTVTSKKFQKKGEKYNGKRKDKFEY